MFLKKVNLLIPILILVFTSSCNKDYYSVGIELYDNQFSDLKSKIFPVFSYQESLDKVQTNNLSSLHLGRYNDNFFGEINSSFISQLNISSIGDFGDFSQEQENEGSLTDIRVMVEDEQITSVYLDLPFYNNTNDSDNDGVIDIYDVDPNNSLSDSDTDGLSDLEELRLGTNPLNPDTDNDGIIDSQDNETIGYNPDSQVYEIDSIFGNRNGEFDLKVFELTYYLNDLDPSNNFESLKEYFSNDDFYQEGFYGETLHDDKVKLDFNEISVFYNEDDPATEDVNELNEVNYFETPRIRVPLDTDFFQQLIINKEGSDELAKQSSFNNYFKGLIVKAENFSDNLYMLLDLSNARVVINYDYNYYNANGTDDVTDDIIERKKKTSSIPFGGVSINLYDHTGYNQQIVDEINSSKENNTSKKIYLNGSKFISKLKLFSDGNSISEDLRLFKENDILINEANLVLYIDESIHGANDIYLPKRLYLYSFNNGEPIEDYNKDQTVDFNPFSRNTNKYTFGGFLQYDSSNNPISYKFDITNHVSNIIRHDSLNIDLGLTITSDIDNVFLRKGFISPTKTVIIPESSVSFPFPVALFGSNPDLQNISKQLKLEVLYSEY